MDDRSSYDRTRERLEEIVVQVKSKDVPLEKSLELYEEALRLGNVCAEMIDRTDFSAEELERAGAGANDGDEELELEHAEADASNGGEGPEDEGADEEPEDEGADEEADE